MYRPCSERSGKFTADPKVAVQSSCSFICCSGMWTETTRCANNGKKLISWWSQVVQDALRTKKVIYKAWLQEKVESSLHSWYAEARKTAALTVEKSKMQSWMKFGHKVDSNYSRWQANKVFWQTNGRLCWKWFHTDRSICVLISNEGNMPWQMETRISKITLTQLLSFHRVHRRYIWGGKYYHPLRSLSSCQSTKGWHRGKY